jgi:adenine-specific DNA-methyltransferase
VLDYLAHGQAQALHQRYLTRMREPWYKLEKRQPCPIWFGVFSRAGFKIIRNHSHAPHLTCYHGFTPNEQGQIWLDHLFLYLHSRAGRTLLGQNRLQYGASLDKFEPNDLNRALCPCPDWFNQAELDCAAEMAHLLQHAQLRPTLERRFDDLLG